MAKRIITGDPEQKEPKLEWQKDIQSWNKSEADVVKSLNSSRKSEVEQACLDDLAYIERKYRRKSKLPQWQSKEAKEKLDRMVARFKQRRYDILKELNVSKTDLEVRID